MSKLEIRPAGDMGRGVYAAQKIKCGEVIEVSPVIVIPYDEKAPLLKTIVEHYVFQWGKKYTSTDASALALGVGSLFNHDKNPNATYWNYEPGQVIIFTAVRDIEPGEQIFVNYGYDAEIEFSRYRREKSAKREDEVKTQPFADCDLEKAKPSQEINLTESVGHEMMEK